MTIEQAIHTLSQSDPIVKLLQQVKLGRMKPADAGLRAITETWLGTYLKVVEEGTGLGQAALRRLDPSPRLAVLIEAGVLPGDHPEARALADAYSRALAATVTGA
jgi:hypothetical protein